MDFWQTTALVFMVLAFVISAFEAVQLAIQLSVLRSINQKLAKVDEIIDKLEASYGAGTNELKTSLQDILVPIKDKFLALDIEHIPDLVGKQLCEAIDRQVAKFDTDAFIDRTAQAFTTHIQASIPDMVSSAGEETQQMIADAKEDPWGTFIGLAMMHAMQPKNAPAAPAQPSTGQIRQV